MTIQHTSSLIDFGTVYSREPLNPHIAVADGYGLSVTVNRGHLVVKDGIGEFRRTRRFSRIERQIKRLVIMGRTGSISLDAMQWCADVGIQLVVIDRQGQTMVTSTTGCPDARLLRAQALTGEGGSYEDVGTEIGRFILAKKLEGQRDVAATLLRSGEAADYITNQLGRLQTATDVRAMRNIEANSALTYWAAWAGLRLPWSESEVASVPKHWRTYGKRYTVATRGRNRNSVDPANSILNYAYKLAAAECRLALVAVGLDPSLGYMHLDEQSRDSLALDVMEIVRPDVEAWLFNLLTTGKLDRRWFYEAPDGTCRLIAPLTHYIAEQMPLWGSAVSPYVGHIARMISDSGKGDVRPMRPRELTVEPLKKKNRRLSRSNLPTGLTVESLVPDELWERVSALIPETAVQAGRPWIDSRSVLAGIVCVEILGSAWAHIPATLGVSRWTCKTRLDKWRQEGAWDAISDAVKRSKHLDTMSH